MTGPTLEGLAEDVEDLKANQQGFAAELELQKRMLDGLRDAAPEVVPAPAGAGDGPAAGNGPQGGAKGSKEKPAAPPFILRLEGDAYAGELSALAAWVAKVIVPVYGREPSTEAPWCARWWEHEEAIARLHALWLAWQELTDPATGGRTGPGVWHRDYLDPCMGELRHPKGPFTACMVTDAHQQHLLLPPPALEEFPDAVTAAP